jgi:hypothetical protein
MAITDKSTNIYTKRDFAQKSVLYTRFVHNFEMLIPTKLDFYKHCISYICYDILFVDGFYVNLLGVFHKDIVH